MLAKQRMIAARRRRLVEGVMGCTMIPVLLTPEAVPAPCAAPLLNGSSSAVPAGRPVKSLAFGRLEPPAARFGGVICRFADRPRLCQLAGR